MPLDSFGAPLGLLGTSLGTLALFRKSDPHFPAKCAEIVVLSTLFGLPEVLSYFEPFEPFEAFEAFEPFEPFEAFEQETESGRAEQTLGTPRRKPG